MVKNSIVKGCSVVIPRCSEKKGQRSNVRPRKIGKPNPKSKVLCPECKKEMSRSSLHAHMVAKHNKKPKNNTKKRRDLAAVVEVPTDYDAFTTKLVKMYEGLEKKDGTDQSFVLRIAQDASDFLNKEKLLLLKKDVNAGLSTAEEETLEEEDKEDDIELKVIRRKLAKTIVPASPDIKLSDVVGLDECKELLESNAFLPIIAPQLFEGAREPWAGVLLFGPPGNGKTFLAKALANQMGLTMFSISAADIGSKWHGESEKIVKQLFKLAAEKKPSVIFLDEVESMCRHRDSTSNAHNSILAEFLKQMDGCGTDRDGVLVLGATNKPWDLDSAILRRFEMRYYIPLPDASGRAWVLQGFLAREPNSLTEAEIGLIAEKTEGYSNSDMKTVMKTALKVQMGELTKATTFKPSSLKIMRKGVVEVKPGYFKPCPEDDPQAIKMRMKDNPSKVVPSKLSMAHFMKSAEVSKPSTKFEELEMFTEWTKLYAQVV